MITLELARECHNWDCHEPPSGEGTGVFICVHEHMSRQRDYCRRCWAGHLPSAHEGSLSCAECYYAAPHDHECRMAVIL